MAERYKKATVGDSGWTADKQRCRNLLLEWVGGEHRLGKLTHFGTGLRMTTWRDVATFDDDLLTLLVILAHKHACRIAIVPAGAQHLAICVWAREAEGGQMVRHPGLRELIQRCEQHEREDIDNTTDTEQSAEYAAYLASLNKLIFEICLTKQTTPPTQKEIQNETQQEISGNAAE